MSESNREKPSPILMLAPIAIVLLGYHYLFHSKINKEVIEQRELETRLQNGTQNIQREQSTLLSQLNTAQKELDEAEEQIARAESNLAEVDAEKAKLRAFFNSASEAGNKDGDIVNSIDTLSSGPVSSIFTSTQSAEIDRSLQKENFGKCNDMNLLCSILDSHRLRRLSNTDPSRGGGMGLVEKERSVLGKLLGVELAPVSKFRLQLEGSFLDLIDALHVLDQRMPTVSILSVSLEPGDINTRRRVWNLMVGIDG